MRKKHELLAVSGTETIIGAGVKLKGTLTSEGDIQIDGLMSGDIKVSGNVTIGYNARIKANIKAQNVRVSGELTGNITADNDTAITETGQVTGDIKTGTISIGPGAFFSGNITMPQHKVTEPEE
jgi:cytoskeletal protein CcmA (bactofilin family)